MPTASSGISLTDAIAGASAFFALSSGIIAYFSIVVPRRAQKSQEMRDQAVLSLDRAYHILAGSTVAGRSPPSDRLSWLSAARLLVQYRRIKGKVTLDEHKLVLEEQEEYWRHRFYLLLEPTSYEGLSYYQGAGMGSGLYLESVAVIYRFVQWPEDRDDPIDIDLGDIEPQEVAFLGYPSLQEFVRKSERWELSFCPSSDSGLKSGKGATKGEATQSESSPEDRALDQHREA